MTDTLRAAAQAVVDRWDTPLWKDVPATAEYIGRLRASLEIPENGTNTAERETLMDLIDAYAEARHVGGCHTYNAKTAEARAKVIASLAASEGSEPVAWVDERVISWLANSRSRSATISTTLEKGKSSERPMPLYTHPSPPEGAGAEQALLKVLSVVQRYLPPDGLTAHDAMSEITAIVDPWPLGPLEKP